jgi:hypothetical protein
MTGSGWRGGDRIKEEVEEGEGRGGRKRERERRRAWRLSAAEIGSELFSTVR